MKHLMKQEPTLLLKSEAKQYLRNLNWSKLVKLHASFSLSPVFNLSKSFEPYLNSECTKVKVGNDQEMAQSERSTEMGKTILTVRYLYMY